MPKYLVIVESPAKVKTIKKFLGANYNVVASNGHVRDLPKSTLGVDIENDYEPKYITIRGKGDKLAELRKEVKKVDKVYLATDPDREGEAISWHLATALKLDDKKMSRITFNEITKNAVKASLKNPRTIDMNLVDAQQARRMLDRMVGYTISPLLWQKVKRGLSAGRVQSVALRMICDREEEINEFIPEEYWTLDVNLLPGGHKKPIVAKLHGYKNKKIEIKNRSEMDKVLAAIDNATYSISEIKKGERIKKSPLPFTTSTLQQEASKTLNFSTQKTMRIAQQLYEGIDIKGQGTIGIISYLRTDSTRVSEEADNMAREFINKNYGESYLAKQNTQKKSDNKIQDAHEAIRPTNMELTPARIKDDLSRDQFRLYQLIWKRFTASRMENAKYETTSIKISAGDYDFICAASKLAFDGFMSVYMTEDDKEENKSNVLMKNIDKDSKLQFVEHLEKQHFTQPPARYTEASFVKLLEEKGIGRPSTYVPTISTLLSREYIVREKKNLMATELGFIVNNILSEYFKQIVDVDFTAAMEGKLDNIEEGSESWTNVVEEFFAPLKVAIDKAEKEVSKVVIEDKVSDVPCDKCGKMMVIKHGRYGDFLACPGYPECKNAKPIVEELDVDCPKCGGKVLVKRSKKGKKFFGCSNYPDCDFVSWNEPVKDKCEECGSYMVLKYSKTKGKYVQCSNSECGNIKIIEEKEKDN